MSFKKEVHLTTVKHLFYVEYKFLCSDHLSGMSQMVGTTRQPKVGQALRRDDDCSPDDKVDDNISRHGCKTPDQSSFLGLCEASKTMMYTVLQLL